MTENARSRTQLFTGLAVALLLLTAGTDGTVSAALAGGLFVVGLILFPELRRVGIVAAAVAAIVAVVIGLTLRVI